MRDKPLPELIRLSEAAAELGLKVSSLRTEIRKGRLTPVEIAGRFYLTRESLGEMIKACRVKPKDHDSISNATETVTDGGSFATGDLSVAQAAARQSIERLKKLSRPTSPRNTSRAGRPIA